MSHSAFLSTCHSSVPAPQSQTTGLASHLVIGSPTPSFSLSFSVSHTDLLSFSIPCFTLLFRPGCLAVSSASCSAFSLQHAHDSHPHWEPWPLTAHWHPPIPQWEMLTGDNKRGKMIFLLFRYYHPTISTGDQQMTSWWNIKPRLEQSSWAHAHTYAYWAARHTLSVHETRVLTNMLLYLVVTSAKAVQQCLMVAWIIRWYSGWDSSKSVNRSIGKQT